MDTRRARGSRDDRPRPDVTTDTVPVELVELESVGKPPRSTRSKRYQVVGVIGILAAGVAFAATNRPAPTPTVSPGPTQVAQATSPTPSPAIATAPASTPAIPPATASPAWFWRSEKPFPDLELEPLGMWGVGGHVLMQTSLGGSIGGRSLSFAHFEAGHAWDLRQSPPAITELFGGSVINDRLWFIGSVGGVTADDTTYQLVSTQDGINWESRGVTDGLGTPSNVGFIGRVGDTWVASPQLTIDDGPTRSELMWSDDGALWEHATVPDLLGDPEYWSIGVLGETAVVLGWLQTDGRAAIVLTSNDLGRSWRVADVLPENVWPAGLACKELVCVMTTNILDGTGPPIAWTTWDLEHWTDATVSPGTYLEFVTTTDHGFLGVDRGDETTPTVAWLSGDGATWNAVDVISAGEPRALVSIAATGDDVFGVASSLDGGPMSIWRGRLGAMLGYTDSVIVVQGRG